MKISNDWSIKVLSSGALLCCILLVLAACIQMLYLMPGTSENLTNSDIIQLPTLFLDLRADINNFWGWKLPDAPYYFPDTAAFLLINWLIQDSWWSIPVYSLFQVGLLISALI